MARGRARHQRVPARWMIIGCAGAPPRWRRISSTVSPASASPAWRCRTRTCRASEGRLARGHRRAGGGRCQFPPARPRRSWSRSGSPTVGAATVVALTNGATSPLASRADISAGHRPAVASIRCAPRSRPRWRWRSASTCCSPASRRWWPMRCAIAATTDAVVGRPAVRWPERCTSAWSITPPSSSSRLRARRRGATTAFMRRELLAIHQAMPASPTSTSRAAGPSCEPADRAWDFSRSDIPCASSATSCPCRSWCGMFVEITPRWLTRQLPSARAAAIAASGYASRSRAGLR